MISLNMKLFTTLFTSEEYSSGILPSQYERVGLFQKKYIQRFVRSRSREATESDGRNEKIQEAECRMNMTQISINIISTSIS